jgi:hypothetical protein
MSTDHPPTKGAEKLRVLSLRDAPKEFKVALLKELGYGVDGSRILAPNGERYADPYSGVEVSVENMVILPGRSPPIILDDSPLSLAYYMDEYGEIF